MASSLAGKAYSITMKAIDYATAPIRALINLAKNPIAMVITATGVTFGVQDIISTSSSYEQSMANTRAVTGANDEEMSIISTEVRRLGASTAYSATEVGDASTILGTAGWDAQSIASGLGGILNLAAAGDVEVDTAAGITTSTIAQWGLTADDSDHVADVLAKTALGQHLTITRTQRSSKIALQIRRNFRQSTKDYT